MLLLDGPLTGEIVTYSHPLPHTLVVADKVAGGWHDYTQTERIHNYRHSDRCPCIHPRLQPVNLDAM